MRTVGDDHFRNAQTFNRCGCPVVGLGAKSRLFFKGHLRNDGFNICSHSLFLLFGIRVKYRTDVECRLGFLRFQPVGHGSRDCDLGLRGKIKIVIAEDHVCAVQVHFAQGGQVTWMRLQWKACHPSRSGQM